MIARTSAENGYASAQFSLVNILNRSIRSLRVNDYMKQSSDMRNGFFKDSELIKDEIDDMEESLGHFEVAEALNPIEGRPISGRELKGILEMLRCRTVFTIEYDLDRKEYFKIHIPLLRELLISAEVEQELFFQWGYPSMIHWSDCILEPYTEYCYYLSEILKNNDFLRTKRTKNLRLRKRFIDLFTRKNELNQPELDNLCNYYLAVGQGKRVDPQKRKSIFTTEAEKVVAEYASCINEIIGEFSSGSNSSEVLS